MEDILDFINENYTVISNDTYKKGKQPTVDFFIKNILKEKLINPEINAIIIATYSGIRFFDKESILLIQECTEEIISVWYCKGNNN